MRGLTRRVGIIPYFLFGILIAFFGLMALNHIVNSFWPIDVERLDLVRAVAADNADPAQLLKAANLEIVFSFLAAVIMTITGLSMPVMYFFNRRFGRQGSSTFSVVLRQSMWVAIWVAFCFWLQMNRSLGLGLIVLVAAVFIVLELMLQVRTKVTDLAVSGD